MSLTRISQSKVKCWQQCRYAYGLKYCDHLKKNIKSRPLKFGTIVHKMLEAHANGDDPFETLSQVAVVEGKLFKAEVEMYGDIVNDIRYIMEEYFRYYAARDVTFVRVDGRNAEHKFEIEIAPGVLFTGKVDGITRKKASRLRWLCEHKTYKRKPSVEHRWRNMQSCVYFRAIEIMGWPSVEGAMWDYINSKAPAKPELVSKGTRISARSITTLPNVVKAFLAEHNMSVVKNRDYIKAVENSRSEYFERVFTPIKPNVVGQVFDQFVETAKEMAELGGIDRRRTIAMHCDWCDYEPLCRAEFMGNDIEYLKETLYHINEDQYDETPAIDEGSNG